MARLICLAAILSAFTGCGLAETGASAAAGGTSKAEEVRQAQETEARIKRQLYEAQRKAAEQRAAMDEATQ